MKFFKNLMLFWIFVFGSWWIFSCKYVSRVIHANDVILDLFIQSSNQDGTKSWRGWINCFHLCCCDFLYLILGLHYNNTNRGGVPALSENWTCCDVDYTFHGSQMMMMMGWKLDSGGVELAERVSHLPPLSCRNLLSSSAADFNCHFHPVQRVRQTTSRGRTKTTTKALHFFVMRL